MVEIICIGIGLVVVSVEILTSLLNDNKMGVPAKPTQINPFSNYTKILKVTHNCKSSDRPVSSDDQIKNYNVSV